MSRWLRTLVLGGALALAPSVSKAQSSRSFDVCGGQFQGMSVFALCAAADVSVALVNNQPTVSINVWNLSGSSQIAQQSYAWTTLVGIGLTNIVPNTVNVVNGSLKVTGPCSANPNGCDYSQYWWIGNDFTFGGLVIDLFSYTATSSGIASSCDPNTPFLTRTPYLYTACDRTSPQYVTVSFAVTDMFDLANGGDLFLKATNDGPITYCVTGPNQPGCVPIIATPEPGTLALLGSGFAGFGGLGFFRRRRRPVASA